MISTRGRYALRVMIDLANNQDDGYIPMKVVAAREGISLKYLEQIMPVLTRNGLVDTLQGKYGGYRLRRKPEEYTVCEILELTEGSLAAVACLAKGASVCDREAGCVTKGFWKGLDDVIHNYLNSHTLADFVEDYEISYMDSAEL